MSSVTRMEAALELELDLRLHDLWRLAAGTEEWNLATAAAFMRAAYGRGYQDAFTDPDPAKLYTEYGCAVPVSNHRPNH